jgi:hypothetical protein
MIIRQELSSQGDQKTQNIGNMPDFLMREGNSIIDHFSGFSRQ